MPIPKLNLPGQLEQEALRWAGNHHVSLEEFVTWAVAEKIARLERGLEDPRFPHVSYRLGASRWPVPVVRGTGIRVQTLVIASQTWSMSAAEIAEDYDLSTEQVEGALAFYEAHRSEIDAAIESEDRLELATA